MRQYLFEDLTQTFSVVKPSSFYQLVYIPNQRRSSPILRRLIFLEKRQNNRLSAIVSSCGAYLIRSAACLASAEFIGLAVHSRGVATDGSRYRGRDVATDGSRYRAQFNAPPPVGRLANTQAPSFIGSEVRANERGPRVFASSRSSAITRHEANTGMQRPRVARWSWRGGWPRLARR